MNTFKFQVEAGEQTGEEFTLRPGDNVVGRSRIAQVRLCSADVSSQHARVSVLEETVVVSNLSQYGLWVGDRKLQGTESAPIEVGQLIRVGKNALRLHSSPLLSSELAASGHTVLPAAAKTQLPPASADAPKPDERESRTSASSKTVAPADMTVSPPPDDLTAMGVSRDFDVVMRAKAASADLEGDDGDEDDDRTHVQKTVFAPQGELERRLLAERKKPRHRLVAIIGASIFVLTLLFVFLPKPVPEGRLEFDQSYDIGETNAPLGGFKVLYPKNLHSQVLAKADGLVVSTLLGRKQDVRLVITLQESVSDKWATRDSEKNVQEWMQSHPDQIFGLPSAKFEGQQNGVWVWSIPYTRTNSEAVVGETRLFFSGRRLEAVSAEVPGADQGRAENMFKGCTYFDFLPDFEASCWVGLPLAGEVNPAAVLKQIGEDLRRDAPLTWAAITRQLRQVLSQSVAEKNSSVEEQALRLLVGLRQQQVQWFNSQRLLVISADRAADARAVAEITHRCQAVFSDPSDNRYFEVRKW